MRLAFWRRSRPYDCREVRRLMQAFLDGELSAREMDRVAAHVEDCRPCGIDSETYRRIKADLARLRVAPDRSAVARLERFVDELTASDR